MARATVLIVFFAALFSGGSALADKAVPIESVSSPVYETEGDHQAISRRGATCLAQILKPGFTTAPTILSTDIEGGKIVANNAYEYVDKFLISTVEQGRSTVTFEAKDGRFRLVHTSIETFLKPNGWRPAMAWSKKADVDPARLKLMEISEAVAKCVKAGVTDNW